MLPESPDAVKTDVAQTKLADPSQPTSSAAAPSQIPPTQRLCENTLLVGFGAANVQTAEHRLKSVPLLGTSASGLIELREFHAGAKRGDRGSRFFDQLFANHRAESRAAPLSQVFDKQQHSMPARIELICNPGNLRDVIRNRNRIASESREHGEISCSRKIRAKESAIANLQFDTQQRVQHLN